MLLDELIESGGNLQEGIELNTKFTLEEFIEIADVDANSVLDSRDVAIILNKVLGGKDFIVPKEFINKI